MVDECLSLNGVLPVVKGEPSPRISTIIDMPVESLVVPADVNHPGYASALRTQLQWQTTNAANERKRFQIIMEDWTTAYNLIAASCTKHAPQLKQVLRDNCAITNVPGQYYDGPRAYLYLPETAPPPK